MMMMSHQESRVSSRNLIFRTIVCYSLKKATVAWTVVWFLGSSKTLMSHRNIVRQMPDLKDKKLDDRAYFV
jgi:hypothetical protein